MQLLGDIKTGGGVLTQMLAPNQKNPYHDKLTDIRYNLSPE